ncbi:MAG: hypothetical protein KY476_11360 [Planctomycetes bacterium]|nr:hypothetical protein [Planctomycetota bacterium]
MDLAYFVFDADGVLHRVRPNRIEAVWKGRSPAEAVGVRLDDELRLISALRDERLMPVVCYFVRLELEDGYITDDSRCDAYEAMTARNRRRYDHPAARRQFEGWPADWPRQLAVALDVAVDKLRRLGLGGPLLMADLWGIPIAKVVQYFEEAAGESL